MIDISELSTYRAGVYQAKAYRVFKTMKNAMLAKYSLSMMQWSVLGFIYDTGEKGIRITTLANELDTTQAFITTVVNALESKGFVTRTVDESDTRAKKVRIEVSRRDLIEEIEQDLRAQLRSQLYSKITRDELIAYMTVAEKFSSTRVNTDNKT